MCGRYANYIRDLGDWEKILGDWPDDIDLGYNIAPTQTVPVFIDHKRPTQRNEYALGIGAELVKGTGPKIRHI